MQQHIKRLAAIGLLSAACLINVERDGVQVAHASESGSSDGARSASTLRGSYGFDGSGNIPGFGDFVSNGVLTFFPNGTLVATESLNLAGESYDNTYTGSYTVNGGDTGTFITVDQFGQTSTFSLVLTANRQRASGVLRGEGILALLRLERQ